LLIYFIQPRKSKQEEEEQQQTNSWALKLKLKRKQKVLRYVKNRNILFNSKLQLNYD